MIKKRGNLALNKHLRSTVCRGQIARVDDVVKHFPERFSLVIRPAVSLLRVEITKKGKEKNARCVLKLADLLLLTQKLPNCD